MLQLKLKRFMRQNKVTQVALADAISDFMLDSGKSITDRYLRYIVNNTSPLTGENRDKKPSLVVLGFIIKGLRELTGQKVSVTDVLEYQTLTPETQTIVVELPLENESEHETNVLPTEGFDLVPISSDGENEKVLDDIWELTVHTLEQRGYPELSRIVAAFNESTQEAQPSTTEQGKRRFKSMPFLLGVFLVMALGYIALDHFIFKPQLLASSSRLSLFSDFAQLLNSLYRPLSDPKVR